MLGAEGNDSSEIGLLAQMERAAQLVRYVAMAGRHYEPDNPFWAELLTRLPETAPLKSGVIPHPTRFVAMTGLTRRGVQTVTQWIRPALSSPVHG